MPETKTKFARIFPTSILERNPSLTLFTKSLLLGNAHFHTKSFQQIVINGIMHFIASHFAINEFAAYLRTIICILLRSTFRQSFYKESILDKRQRGKFEKERFYRLADRCILSYFSDISTFLNNPDSVLIQETFLCNL